MELAIRHDWTEVVHVISEPGDATRYTYSLLLDEQREHWIVFGDDSTIKFPSPLDVWRVRDYLSVIIEETDIHLQADMLVDYAELYACNPHTLREVVLRISNLDKS